MRASLGERERLLSHEASWLRSSELQRETSGDSRWRRSLDLPLSWLLVSLGLILEPWRRWQTGNIFIYLQLILIYVSVFLNPTAVLDLCSSSAGVCMCRLD